MALCNDLHCGCALVSGVGVIVSGSGTASDPWVLSAAESGDFVDMQNDIEDLQVAQLALPSTYVNVVGDDMTGNLTFTTAGQLGFGARLGQFINLFSNVYGIGIQSGSVYLRTSGTGSFRFFHGGTHADSGGDAGGGVQSVQIGPDGVYLPTDPTHSWHAARKFYVDNQIATRVANTTGTISTSLTVGTEGTTSHFIRCGGQPTVQQAGAQLRADGAISSRMEDPTGITTNNLSLDRAGATTAAAGGTFIWFGRSASTASSSVEIGSVRVRTGGSAVDYNETSDYRLKNVIGPVVDAAGRIMALQPRRLAWKTDGSEFDGFLAHEVAVVVPEAVTGEKDALTPEGQISPQQMAPTALIPLLTAAVQELAIQIGGYERPPEITNPIVVPDPVDELRYEMNQAIAGLQAQIDAKDAEIADLRVDTHDELFYTRRFRAHWQYSNTVGTPPGAGQLRSNVPLTHFYMHKLDADGYNREIQFDFIPYGSLLRVRGTGGGVFEVRSTGPAVDNGDWYSIPIAVVSGTPADKGFRVEVTMFTGVWSENAPPAPTLLPAGPQPEVNPVSGS